MIHRLLIAATIAAAIASGALAHDPVRRHYRAEKARCIELSDDQRETMRDLRDQEREASRPIREELRAAALEYKRLSDSEDPGAKAQLERVRNLREGLAARRLALRAGIEKVLTPEQKVRAAECRRERRDR